MAKSLSVAWLAAAAAVTTAPVGAAAPSSSRIRVVDRYFVDEHRRVRIWHGFNDVGEETKRTGPFDGFNYLPQHLISNESRLGILVNEYGFNAYRIGAIWAALQPSPNVTDTVYLAALQNATRMLARHGAYSILDMHQDALSNATGWSNHDGAPAWVVNRTTPRHAYPWPYRPGKNGGDAAEAVAQAFQDIYQDTHGGRRAWASAWKSFASTFKGEPGIIAYELMNEPFAGDIYHDPLLLDPAFAGSHNLQPAYDVVADTIREVDDATVIMYEPVTWGMIFDTRKIISAGSGFSHVPGGSAYANRSAYSYHYYCWPGREHMGDQACPACKYSSLRKAACQSSLGLGPKVFSSVQETVSTLGGASFLTEWGGVYFTPCTDCTPDSTAVDEANWVMDEADAGLQSWTHWDLNYFLGNHIRPNPESFLGCPDHFKGCIKDFIRPYAQAIAGTPTHMKYDRATNAFTLSFQPDGSIAAPTEIFLPPYRYPSGYSVKLEPAEALFTTATCPGFANKLCVTLKSGAAAPALLTVTVTPPM